MRIKDSVKEANRIRSKKVPRLSHTELAKQVYADSDATDASKLSMLSNLEHAKLIDIRKVNTILDYTGVTLDFLLGRSDEPFN